MTEKLLKDIESGSKNALLKKKIISSLIKKTSFTLPDLSKELDLSVPTVTKIVGGMCEDGHIRESGKIKTSSGRRPTVYELNPESCYFVGVAIKKFSLSVGILNFGGEMVESDDCIPYRFDNTPDSLETLCRLVKEYIEKSEVDLERIMNVCITISGRVNPESGYSFSIFNYSERPLSEIISEKTGYPVCIDNDTRVMTYGELLQGCAQGESNVIFVNLSWGIGIGIIIDGTVYTGKSGFAGEFGHIISYDNEILCHCGKKGCLETEVSGSALHRIFIERVLGGESSLLSAKVQECGSALPLDEIIGAINREDPLSIEILEEIGQKLGKHIAGLINIFNPSRVILGGSLSTTGEYLLAPVRTAVRKFSLNLVNKDTSIVSSRLQDRAGMIGACMLARSRTFELY